MPAALASSTSTPGRNGVNTIDHDRDRSLSNPEPAPTRRKWIYVGGDVGYRQHVAAASPLSVLNAQRSPNAWRQVRPADQDKQVHPDKTASGGSNPPVTSWF